MQKINNCVSNRRQICALTLAFLLAAVFVPFAKANDGILDYNFGEGGKVSTNIDTTYKEINQMVTQPDGKIIALSGRRIGSVGSSIAAGFALLRYNPDGNLDNTFGTNGVQRAGLEFVGVEGGFANAIALQTDGKIVVAGSGRNRNIVTGYNFAVARFNADGTVDTSFGTGGLVNTPFPQGNCQPASACNFDGANAVAIQADGKILVAGFATPDGDGANRIALARYKVNGSLDTGNIENPNTNFGTNGIRLVEGFFTLEFAAAMILTSASTMFGNDILVSARYRDLTGTMTPSTGFFFIRFTGNGSTINGGGSNGRSVIIFPNNVVPTGMRNLIPDSNGNLLFLGTASDASTSYDVIAGFNFLGILNPTYGNGGAVLTRLDSNSPSYFDDAIQSDGKIVTVGEILGGNNNDPPLTRRKDVFLTRRNADGSLDMSFGNRGKTVSNFGSEDGARSVVLLPNQRILVGGTSKFAGLDNYAQTPALFRYIPETPSDKFLDLSFGEDGRVTTDFGNGANDWGFGGTVQPDGKIIAVGEVVLTSTNSAFGITRYNSNGSLDMRTTVDVSPNFDIARLPTVQADGKIIVVGVSVLPSGDVNRAIVRLNANGTPDTSFGTNGIVTMPVGRLTSFRTDVRVQPDGKIIVVGTIRSTATSNNSYSVIRLNSNGTFDTSFGIDGQVVTAFENGTNAFVGGAALQTDNKIVVAGNTSGIVTIARYNSNGTLDTSFDGDGKVISTIGTTAQASSVVIQPDGKIVVSGSASSGFMVARYNSNGSFDNSFNEVGFVITRFGTNEIATGLVLQNNKIIATGYTTTGSNSAFAVAKYNDNGSLDTAFGDNGKITTDFTSGEDISFGSALQPDGKLVLFGRTIYSSPLFRDFAIARYNLNGTTNTSTNFDFDGDGRADISVFRPSDRNWYLNRSSQGFAAVQWGLATDKIAPADYDGDGKADVAVWRDEPANPDRANLYIFNSSTLTVKIEQFGRTGDQPLVIGDWDGDGKDDPAIYRNGQSGQQSYFYYRPSSQPSTDFVTVYWGIGGDIPVRGDFDGDGKIDAAVFRPSNATWYIRQSSDSQIRYENWGLATDKFVPADYDGDGKTDLAVFRNGVWYIRNSSNNQPQIINFGISTDIPIAADYDGDGKADVAVFRGGVWYILRSTQGFTATAFGSASDKPVPAAFVP